eukprot:820583-Pelagomonas_calceolata.AAC.1
MVALVTMGFDLQPGSLAAWSALLYSYHDCICLCCKRKSITAWTLNCCCKKGRAREKSSDPNASAAVAGLAWARCGQKAKQRGLALWWRGFTALPSQCVPFSLIDVGRVSSAY